MMMVKEVWKPGNMLYPVPAVLVSSRNKEGFNNLITIAWAGVICSDPPMVSISIRKERLSYEIISETKEFVINLTTEDLVKATDFCGVKSGRELNKFEALRLTPVQAKTVKAPLLEESPVNLECKVKKIIKLGSHDMFIAEITAVHVDQELIDDKKRLHLDKAKLITYSHGQYYGLKKSLGTFGFSVKKKRRRS